MSRRAALVRHRLGGIASSVVSPARLSIFGPPGGAPLIVSPNSLQVGVSGFADVGLRADVRVNDFLYWTEKDRWFRVTQLAPFPAVVRALVAEISAPLPDEFALQMIESWWTTTASGFSILTTDGSMNLTTMPAATLPSVAKGCYQLVSGDFDVWTRLRADSGSGGNVRHALLGARDPASGLGIYMGLADNGVDADLRRFDEYQVATLNIDNILVIATATYAYVRLKRSGGRFRTFHRTGAVDPTTENDWTEDDNSAAVSFSSSAAMRVGLFGYTNNSTLGEARWQFLRNWAV